MAQKDRFSAIERALPFAAILETIATRGKSPGTTSLGQLERIDTLRAGEAKEKESAIDRALGRQKTQLEIDRLKKPSGLTVAQKKFKQTEDEAIKRLETNDKLRKDFAANPGLFGVELTPLQKIRFNEDPLTAIEEIDKFEKQKKIEELKATTQANLLGARITGQKDIQTSKAERELKKLQIKSAKDLSKQLTNSNIPAAITLMNKITDDLKIDDPKNDIEGFGATGSLPKAGLSDKGKSNRQIVQSFINITLKDRSGAAVTTPEFDRFKTEVGSGFLMTDNQLRTGFINARNSLIAKIKNIEAPFILDIDEGTLQELRSLGVQLSSDISTGLIDENDALLDELGVPK